MRGRGDLRDFAGSRCALAGCGRLAADGGSYVRGSDVIAGCCRRGKAGGLGKAGKPVIPQQSARTGNKRQVTADSAGKIARTAVSGGRRGRCGDILPG